MSSIIVTTITPFIDKDILCDALSNLGVKYTVENNRINTNRTDEVGNQCFEYMNNKWVYKSNTAYSRISMKNGEVVLTAPEKEYGAPFGQPLAESFLKEVEQEYYKLIQNPDSEISGKNKLYVEQRKQEIIAKAIAEGYKVEESVVNNKVQLVIARNSY